MEHANAAIEIIAHMGCYNIMLHKVPALPKPKKIAFGENLRMGIAKKQATPARLARHKEFQSKTAARNARYAAR